MSINTWLRALVHGSLTGAKRQQIRNKAKKQSKIQLLCELLENRIVPASPVNYWLGTDAYPLYNQGLIGQYWQGSNGGSGPTGNYTETYSTMLLKSAGAASWIGSPSYSPAGVNFEGNILLNGIINFPSITANSFTDSLGNVYVGKYWFAGNPRDGSSTDNLFARWTGFINIPTNGVTNANGSNPIAFRIGSDDGSALYIDGGTSVNSPVGGSGTNFTAPGTGTFPQINNASYQGVTFRSVTLNLTPGLHAIDVEYFNGGGGGAMYFNWDPTGGTHWADMPNDSYFYAADPPTSTNHATGQPFPANGNNWSDARNWSLGRAPINGDTVVFDDSRTGFNPNNYDSTGPAGAAIWNPNNDIGGLSLNGIVMDNTGALSAAMIVPAAWEVTGNAVTINNTDTTFTNGISNTTVHYPWEPGLVPSSTQPITNIVALGQNGAVNGPIVLGSNVVVTDVGPAATSSTAGQASLLIASPINLAGHTLTLGPSAAAIANQTPDTGYTILNGAIFNGDMLTRTGTSGNVVLSYLGAQAAIPFTFSSATTAASLASYLTTIPGLSSLPAANVTGPNGGPFLINLGPNIPTGNVLAVVSGPGTLAFTSMANIPALVEAGYGSCLVSASNSYDGQTNITSGLLIDGVANALGSTFSGGKTVSNINLQPIAGLSSPGAALEFANGGDGATYNYDTVAVSGGAGTLTLSYNGLTAATPGLTFTSVTTAAQFQSYLNTLPGLTESGAVSVVGPNGGPFNVVFGSGVFGGPVLKYVSGPATTITTFATGIAVNGTGVGLASGGVIASADNSANSFAGPITLTGTATLQANTGTLTLNGSVSLGNNALTLAGTNNLILNGAIDGTAAASLTVNSSATVTLGHDNSAFGTGGTSAATTGLVAGGGINILTGVLAVTANQALGAVTANAATQNVVTVSSGATLGFTGVNYLAQQAIHFSGPGVTNGSTSDGAIAALGGTSYFGGALLTGGTDMYLGATAGILTLGNNGAPVSLATNNLYFVGTGGTVVLNVPITGNTLASVGTTGGASDNIIKNGLASARLTQSSPTFYGSTTINAGVLQAGADQAFGDGTHSTVTALIGGAVGLFNYSGFNYATPQALTLVGSGSGNGALENGGGNNTFAGVMTFTGPTTIGSDADTLTLTANINQNYALTFTGAGNTVVSGVISSPANIQPLAPGFLESQSSLAADFTSARGNFGGTDQVLFPVMGTTTSSVPGTYGYYPTASHIWSNKNTWFYQGLINVPNWNNTGDGYLSFAKSIDDAVQILIDGQVILRSTTYSQSLGSGELTLTSGYHAIDIRVSNAAAGAGANGSNSNGWTGFVPGQGGNNVIGPPYGNGIVFRIDQGPNDPAGVFVGVTSGGISTNFPNGTYGLGMTSSGVIGAGDAGVDYTIPVDPGDGSLFEVPVSLTKSGNGSLTLMGANTYDSPTDINQGTLIAANNSALGNYTAPSGSFAVVVGSGGVLGLQGGITLPASKNISIAGTGITSLNTGAIENINGNNTIQGDIGNPQFGASATSLGSDAGLLTLNGNITQTTNLSFVGAGNIFVGGTFSGVAGTTSLIMSGRGTVTLNNATSPGGDAITVNSGTLVAAAPGTLGNGTYNPLPITLSGGGVLALGGGISIPATMPLTLNSNYPNANATNVTVLNGTSAVNSAITLTGTSAVGAAHAATLNIVGQVTGVASANLTINGGGTTILANNTNSYLGNTIINSPSTLQITGDGALGSNLGAQVVINGATLDIKPPASYATIHTFVIGATATIDVDANTVTINSAIYGSPSINPTGTLIKTGIGTLALGGVDYYGATSVNQGVLNVLSQYGLGTGKVSLKGGQLNSLGNSPAQGPIPFTSDSFNQDVIWAGTELPNYPGFGTTTGLDGSANDVLYQEGAPFSVPSTGVPANGIIASVFNPAVSFQLQPFTANYDAQIIGTNNSRTLKFANPVALQTLNLLALSANGSASFKVALHFADGTSDITNFITNNGQPYVMPDWLAGSGNYAIQAGRVTTTIGPPNYTPVYSGPASFDRLYETDFKLESVSTNGVADSAKPIASVTFTVTGASGPNTIMNILALSGQFLPGSNPVPTNPIVTSVSILNSQGSEVTPPRGSTASYGFTIHLAKALPTTVIVNYSAVSGSGAGGAKAGVDFQSKTNASVTVPAGVTDVPANITLLGTTPEQPGGPTDKQFTVQLNWAMATGNYPQNIVGASATGNIKQVFAPTLTIAQTQNVHLANGSYGVQVNVASTYPSAAYTTAYGAVMVNYYTTNGTAKSGINFKGGSGTLTIPASSLGMGNSTVTIPITAIGSATGQYFNLVLSATSNNAALSTPSTAQIFIYNPQLVAGTPTDAPGGTVLTSTNQLTPIIQAAKANWVGLGVNPGKLKNVQFQIGNLGKNVLASTAGQVITIDTNADGFGWYINSNDNDFRLLGTNPNLLAMPGTLAVGQIDLLTVIEQKLGHILGLEDVDVGDSLMSTTLGVGVRRLP